MKKPPFSDLSDIQWVTLLHTRTIKAVKGHSDVPKSVPINSVAPVMPRKTA